MKQIIISGEIGWEVTAADVRAALTEAAGEDVEIVISSPGGLVSEGLEIYNLIRNYSGATLARLTGYAMSMASYIPLAADRIVAEDNAVYMIHNARGGAWGDHNAILKYGSMVKALSGMLGKAYAKRTGKPLADIAAMMDQETYLFGSEMVDQGFVDEIIETGEELDGTTAKATASVVFGDFEAKMTAQVQAVKDDLKRAVALAPNLQKITRAEAKKSAPLTQGADVMNIEKLKAEHPDLVTALVAEARAGMVAADDLASQLAAAKEEGAESERARIEEVRAQLVPGHEDLVEKMAFDGKSSAADVALAIVAVEKARLTNAGSEFHQEANKPAKPAENNNQNSKKMNRKEYNKLDPASQGAFVRSGGKVVD